MNIRDIMEKLAEIENGKDEIIEDNVFAMHKRKKETGSYAGPKGEMKPYEATKKKETNVFDLHKRKKETGSYKDK